jgi:drug/metabolite transporter (DMT)-like permease
MTTLTLLRAPARRALGGHATGILAALGAVGIWAAWIVGTRHAVTHTLDPFALGLLRFAVPALFLAPVWWRSGLRPRRLPWLTLAALMGAGAPFFLTVSFAMRHAPAAEIGPMLTGAMPLIVAVLAMILLRERISRPRAAGLVLIALGVAAIGGYDLVRGFGSGIGHALLLTGAAMWASYTLGFKRSGLTALAATAIVAAWSTLLLAPLGVPALVAAWRAGLGPDLLVQAVVQGVLSGVVAILLYGTAIARLGASRGSAFVALVPGLSALLAIPLLGEWPEPAAMIGIVATTLGVALSSGVFSGWTFGPRRSAPARIERVAQTVANQVE